MKKILVLMALFFCISHSKAQSNLDLVKKDVEKAKALLNEGNLKEASKMFDAAIRQSKTKQYKEGHPAAFILIGDAYLTCNSPNLNAAFQCYSTACAMDKNYCAKVNDPVFDALRKAK